MPKKIEFFDCEKYYPLRSIRDLNQEMVNNLGPWVYQFEITKGIYTDPDNKENSNRPEEHHLPYLATHLFGGSFEGLRILDLGCNFGHFSFKALELGAKEVVGVELRQQNLKRAAFVRAVRNVSDVKFYQGKIEDVTIEELGKFDMVIIAGVFLPVQVLENIFEMTRHGVLIDTNIEPSLSGEPIIYVLYDQPQRDNWGIRSINFHPTVPALEKMVKAVGFPEMLELPVKNQPYLNQSVWLNHRTPYKRRRQVFYVFKEREISDTIRKAFPSPWYGITIFKSTITSKVVKYLPFHRTC